MNNLYLPATYIIFALPTVPKSIWILEIPSFIAVFLLQIIIVHLQKSLVYLKAKNPTRI